MKTKHTQGPWYAEGSEQTIATWVRGPDGKRICTMRQSEQDWSNATLIAAAPDLLEALKSISAMLPSDEGLGGHAPMTAFISKSSMIRAAIARAEGEA